MAKKELSLTEFRAIIKEEAMKLKQRMMLENEKKALEAELKQLVSESYMEECGIGEEMMEEEQMNELFGGAFKKAKNDWQATHRDELAKMEAAYKAYDSSYLELSAALKQAARKEVGALAQKYGISGANDIGVLYKDLVKIAEPMDAKTFQRQASQGGASFKDIAGGASSGRQGWTSGNE